MTTAPVPAAFQHETRLAAHCVRIAVRDVAADRPARETEADAGQPLRTAAFHEQDVPRPERAKRLDGDRYKFHCPPAP